MATRAERAKARKLMQCVVCRKIQAGTYFSMYNFRKINVVDRRCKKCTMEARERLRAASITKHGKPQLGADFIKAVSVSNFAQVIFDLERGIKLTGRDKQTGRTAMHEAAVNGDAEMCELLCEKGANVQERAWMARDTPLHYAACADHTPIIVMLCLFGANPDATNKFGQVALHFCHSVDAVDALMRFTERDQIRDHKGRTPKDMAEARGEYDVVNYFEEIRIALLVKDQRALNKEEVAKMQADKEALAIREARFAHETAQDKVKNAVEEYHKWKSGAEVEYQTKELVVERSDKFARRNRRRRKGPKTKTVGGKVVVKRSGAGAGAGVVKERVFRDEVSVASTTDTMLIERAAHPPPVGQFNKNKPWKKPPAPVVATWQTGKTASGADKRFKSVQTLLTPSGMAETWKHGDPSFKPPSKWKPPDVVDFTGYD